MSIPETKKELLKRWNDGERFGLHFFYGHKLPAYGVDDSCFSQWYIRPFAIDGIEYLTAEHWMMAEKARLFQDEETRKLVLQSKTPREAKALGRKVQNFNPAMWDKHKFEIVRRGNFEKFSQHPDLKAYLLSTASYESEKEAITDVYNDRIREKTSGYTASKLCGHTVILVEAAVNDEIWGIGLDQSDAKAINPNTWRGENLLGFALTVVREQLFALHR
jgi:ribA/ribD-fused uncharacterized protein